jgi:hypothetical protein
MAPQTTLTDVVYQSVNIAAVMHLLRLDKRHADSLPDILHWRPSQSSGRASQAVVY